MDTLDAIHTRRSIRKYRDEPVPDELVERILAAAMMAPSARNGQPWQFVVIRDRELLVEIPRFQPFCADGRPGAPCDPDLRRSPAGGFSGLLAD